ncbi:LacI family DNA-binding transcriptional regulator [Nigerium massiliense]|uniref:LacI family DNA-binding transcriptional regulator n=1 Tax=Nigerium massiliense TaxID=1522317 RepID=UPI00058E6CC8|nr:LacI family DNA-binding transcriptional regulator [Nigerium massiliense]
MSVTIKDVAAAVGVSPSTVSRAFSRPDVVDQVTRRRIMDAAERLHYRPNKAAQMLNTGRTGCLGVVLSDLENPFFAAILKGIEQTGDGLGYQTLIADTGENADAERRAIEALSGRVDGLVLCASRLEDAEIVALAGRRPLVLVNRAVEGVGHVSFDNHEGMRQAVGHLAGLGHRAIGYVGGKLQSRSARQRVDGFHQAVAQAAGVRGVMLGDYEPTFDGGRQATDATLGAGITAVVVYNDLMAIGLLNRLLSHGVALPERLSVVSFDNIPVASMVTPALTTVDLPKYEAGRLAAQHLHQLLTEQGSDSQPAEAVLSPRLVARQSTVAFVPRD